MAWITENSYLWELMINIYFKLIEVFAALMKYPLKSIVLMLNCLADI